MWFNDNNIELSREYYIPQNLYRMGSLSNPNIENFRSAVKYLKKYEKNGILNQDEYSEILAMLASIFVKNEIDEKVNKFLKKFKDIRFCEAP